MGSDQNYDPSSTPKLSPFLLPSKGQDPPPGLLTPPVHTPASIPFQWEEAPGKPKPSFMATEWKPKPNSARCLELPPRLLCDAKVMNIPSPTTVLDGPGPCSGSDIGRSFSYSFSSFRANNKEGLLFGSSRWGSFKKNKRAVVGDNNSDSSAEGGGGGGNGGGVKVKIARVRKRSVSFMSLKSHTSSSWASICESFKQAVPWRRRQEKLRKTES